MVRYRLFVLKMQLNNSQLTNKPATWTLLSALSLFTVLSRFARRWRLLCCSWSWVGLYFHGLGAVWRFLLFRCFEGFDWPGEGL